MITHADVLRSLKAAEARLQGTGHAENLAALRKWLKSSVNSSLTLAPTKLSPEPRGLSGVDTMDAVEALNAARNDKAAFEAALAVILADKRIRQTELAALVHNYTGFRPRANANRSTLEQLLRQSFGKRVWDEEAARRIARMSAAE
jgi:hypothetical protein